MAKKKSSSFVCNHCGYVSPKWMGKCPNCSEWNSLVEFHETSVSSNKKTSITSVAEQAHVSKPLRLDQVTSQKVPRVTTQLQELNRVLGGGVVPGSLVLIGGDPGIGKSTLLLQVSSQLQLQGGSVLYVSGEESAGQIKLRAERLGMKSEGFYIYAETDLQEIVNQIEFLKPSFVIIDSIQTMNHPDATGIAGSVSQVREATASLMRLAKLNNIAIFIVGHVTKEGAIAGPRMLEHMVDTVLYFEGEKHHSFRILRSVKNRFGSTNEIGVFEMTQDGLKEVLNPSEVFLEERLVGATGSAVVASMEGTRPILAEVQCLITPTVFGNARRTTSGLDYNRVALLMAVLEKRAGLLLQNQDAYFKSTGGLKLDEPAIDLAVAMSIVSSYKERGTDEYDCFIGEIGLTGEIRRVNRITDRVKEAEKLGFKRIFVPKNNLGGWELPTGIEVIGVATIKEAIKKSGI
ncbi:DNA repair protein RadA [Granulicatella seriolae]|jgi:DNA repair protein RadA/Sms|uniref:DNA repair protein RadA n=1 Tax=Granulicatella seriolae TaxID=2967226 RepID=A0ABT1WP52_9LACT|nr:DNA repair protein RadA [Granulicatella seriolae]